MIFAWAAWLVLAAGCIFIAIAALGALRMPDLFLRMQAATKASALGGALALLGMLLHFQDFAVGARALAGVLFLFMTVPVGAHLIGRAAYRTGVPVSPDTVNAIEDGPPQP